MNSEIQNLKSEFPVIILAGGLGTRLRSVINDLPKPMAPVNGKPFLHYVLLYLSEQNINKVILSVGYQSETIQNYFKETYLGVEISYSYETEPLGTGGGIKKAFELVDDFAFVLNGDTFFDIDLAVLKSFHFDCSSDISIALKPMKKFDRYGTVQMDEERIFQFTEKKFLADGLINGGVYFFHKKIFDSVAEQKFSFEKDVLEKYVNYKKISGKVFDNYFVDIGIPEDYAKVQDDFKNMF